MAAQAASHIRLPVPNIATNPASFSVVDLPTWLWIDPSIWHPYTATATAGGVSATATARPVSVRWDMGDGSAPVTCNGPGIAYEADLPASQQRTGCSHTYLRTSLGQPGPDPDAGAFLVSATITWDVSWTSSSQRGGSLSPL
ncbi:MAG TPA: hypothetical protein VKR22_13495, partial [Acidimicrobiales bacterium]|nr:hypothetical protein [Acidimicrobiales bacterium]